MEHFEAVLIVFSYLLVICYSQGQFNCTAQKKCGDCVALSPECHWCKAENYNGERCNYLTVHQTNCTEGDIVSPKSSKNLTQNERPRNAIGNSPAVLLAPQKIHIKLRTNEPFQFNVVFRQAENYPVDIYFLMDASFTMKEYKNSLSKFTDVLVKSIRNITTDFRLGFGTFVDKTVLPFILTGPNNEIVDQCSASQNCSLPYGFRNQLGLTTNENEFKRRVADLAISANLDAPEGGFDAIMQSIVCMKQIGWREKSRKMILFSTDGSFHYAGDGKLGGIVIPNDGICHLTADGFYSESTNQDYPSISQLAQKIAEKKVNVIFLVPEKQVKLYKRLSDHILGSNVGQLKNDSSNVIDIVKENYDRIRSAVELIAENHDGIRVSFQANCSSGVRKFAGCEGIGIGESVSFIVTIEAESCPDDRSPRTRSFDIHPVGLTEKLTVEVEMICECPCEEPAFETPNSLECNSSGTYECGICTCNRGFYGKKCQCGSASSAEDFQNDMPCRMTNTSEVCQGRGHCECGQCFCGFLSQSEKDKRFSGSYCQCNDYSCDYSRHNNVLQICGGPSRGRCDCGKCVCNSKYTGGACDCLKSTEPCKDAKGVICSGNGNCSCGVCTCSEAFKGPTCEDCPTCPGKCEENRECVLCHFREKNKEECLRDCAAKNKTVHLVDELTNLPEWRSCQLRDDDQCDIHFAYNYKTNAVNATRTKECVYRASNLVIILSVIGGVIALGIIALLIWKVVVTFHDKREYEAFVEEQSKARWDVAQNPVYKPATTNFQNPTYRPGSTINN